MNNLSKINNSICLSDNEKISIHKDITNLIFLDIPENKTYNEKMGVFDSTGASFIIDNINYPVGEEPSLIHTSEPLTKCNIQDVPLPIRYGLTYSKLSSEQKYAYIKFLENPYENANIAYVNLFLFSLERHIDRGLWEQASEILIKLRKIHKNKDFQQSSAKALIFGAVKHNNAKYLYALTDTRIDDDLFLICKYSFKIPLKPKDFIHLSDILGFSKSKYYKLDKNLYNKVLTDIINKKFPSGLILSDFIDNIKQLPCKQFYYQNYSLRIYGNSIDIPQILESKLFKNYVKQIRDAVSYIFDSCLEQIKQKLLTS